MHDNAHIEIRCRELWTQVLTALDARITSVNRYMPEKASHIACQQIDAESVHLQHASSERTVVASLDLKKHAIHLKEYRDAGLQNPLTRKDMPLSMLADGEVYVTDGNELKANAMEVAKSLIELLLGSGKKSEAQVSA